jgi:hypothetical protein
VLFTTDENLAVIAGYVTQPSCVRCLREESWKIVMYFDPGGVEESVYELYDLQSDPWEQHNMACSDPGNQYFDPVKLNEMQQKLKIKMQETGTTPPHYQG